MDEPEKTESLDPDQEAREHEARRLQIEMFAENLLRKRKKAIEHRAASGVESRWREDEETYNDGIETSERFGVTDYASGNAPLVNTQEQTRSRACANIVRGRCETAEGRFVDTCFPVEGKNWSLDTTPIPEMARALKDTAVAMQQGQPIVDDETGQPATMRDVAIDLKRKAEERMEAMESEIDDQLAECDYNGEARKAIRQAIKLGTGIMKGPLIAKETRKVWLDNGGQFTLEVVENHVPQSKFVDCWNVYPSPDCQDDLAKASHVWERGEIPAREVRSLVGVEGYDEEILQEILAEDPKRTTCEPEKGGYKAKTNTAEGSNLYEIWEYHGDVARDDLQLMGCECGDYAAMSACVVFINDRPVKAILNPIDTDPIIYDAFCWSHVDGSPWGIGIPRQMHWWQRIIRAGVRMMLDNAGDSAGANVIVSDKVEPVDGRYYSGGGKKYWRLTPDAMDADVTKAFAQFQIQNNQPNYQALIELALRFVDLETVVPAIFQGEAQEIPETLGATNIMVNSANIAFRMRLKHWDDRVTKRHIRRYYDWNMQYNDKNEIKGDYNVIPIGATALYEQDQQAMALGQVFALKNDPDVNRKTDWDKAIEQYYRMRRLDILKKEEDQEEKEQQQQMPPQAAVAQIRVQGEMERAKMSQASDMEELRFKADQAAMDRQHEKEIKQLEVQMLMLKLANDKNISLDSVKAMLASDSMKLQTQKELAAASGIAKQVTTPPTEPPQQAPSGQAFQQ